MEVLSHFGERADFAPDNKSVAFMGKSYGDAFVVDLKTHVIRCLTCNVPGTAFLRVMYLANGDYILLGPEKFTDLKVSRTRDNEFWYLSKKPNSKPVRMGGVHLHEGAAVSKHSMKVSYSETWEEIASFPEHYSRLMTADVDLSGTTPKLINQKMVYESHDNDCILEAQDFYDNDTKMTFTCYVTKGRPAGSDALAKVMGIDLKTGVVTDFTKSPETYNETEGIYPDGKYTSVEGDRHIAQLGGEHGMKNIDIYKMKLDGTGKDYVRITHFNDYQGWKSSNPVISTDGKMMAFQVGHSTDASAGIGYGVLLYHF
ncbi:hypothetical protein FTO74_15375 [Granulicella sp. WH15]|nr:hypothetical protein FTO74_15375 [Granulicella sp. WH15]